MGGKRSTYLLYFRFKILMMTSIYPNERGSLASCLSARAATGITSANGTFRAAVRWQLLLRLLWLPFLYRPIKHTLQRPFCSKRAGSNSQLKCALTVHSTSFHLPEKRITRGEAAQREKVSRITDAICNITQNRPHLKAFQAGSSSEKRRVMAVVLVQCVRLRSVCALSISPS